MRGLIFSLVVYLPAVVFADDDSDMDGYPDSIDNCTLQPNPGQTDSDGDGAGDACDVCPSTADASQVDADNDGHGDACDNCTTVANTGQVHCSAGTDTGGVERRRPSVHVGGVRSPPGGWGPGWVPGGGRRGRRRSRVDRGERVWCGS